MAEAAPTVRVANHVLNTAFYRPTLLTSDLAAVDSATDGRLVIGLGAGCNQPEFEAAGVSFASAGSRIDHLVDHVEQIRSSLSDPSYLPAPVQTPPPILIGGRGDRMLRTATRHADIVDISDTGAYDHLAQRAGQVREWAGDRAAQIQLAYTFVQVGLDNPDDLSVLRVVAPGTPDEELHASPTHLVGPTEAAVDHIRRLNEELGFSFLMTPAVRWDSLEKLMAALR